jgi:hypothetical protein
VRGPEPERALIRRVSLFAVPAAVIAYAVGALLGGVSAGTSATIAIVIVYINFISNALSIAWAASISTTLVSIVALGGYALRLVIYTITLVLLNELSWFSPVAFAFALVPAVVVLLVYEVKALSGRMQADLWTFDAGHRP